MSRPLRILYPGAYYHVTCRGNDRKKIFSNDEDRKLFFKKLLTSCNIYNIQVLSYVLMNNHFHLLLTTPEGNLSEFMRHFNISYTLAFNRSHRRVGHLYQGRYKAYLVDADSYLLELSRYIHLNPVRIKAKVKRSEKEKWDVLLRYEWSSVGGYLNAGKRSPFVNYDMVLKYVGGDNRKGRAEYRKFVKQGIDKGVKNPLEKGKGSSVLGDKAFVRRIRDTYLKKQEGTREQPALRELKRVFTPQELIDNIVRLTGKERNEICSRGKNSYERAMLMEFLYRFCRITQPEIGALVGGIDYSAVSQARSRLQKRLDGNRKLKIQFDKIGRELAGLSTSKL